MPIVSKRGLDINASPIRSLLPYARKAIQDGKDIIHLNIGQPDIKTPESALAKIKELDIDIVKYGPSEGLTELRATVAEYYKKFQVSISRENIYVTTGASEAILFTLLATCDDQDEIIIPEPFYANYLGFAHLTNVCIKPISTHIESEFSLPSPESFEEKINDKTKAIFLCNPGNPTGQLYTKDQLLALMQIVKKYDLFLIVDEVYREFCYDDEFSSVLTFSNMEKHIVVIDSISKVFSACGARIGYLITRNEDLLKAVNKYAQLRLCPPYYGQKLAQYCYADADRYIQIAKEEYRNRREVLYNRLSNMNDIQCYKPNAAFYNIVTLPIDDANRFCKWMLTDFNLDGETVMLAPASGFYHNAELGINQVRIAYILKEERLLKALDCLELGLEEYQKII